MISRITRSVTALVFISAFAALPAAAQEAEPVYGQPVDGQLGLQHSVTPIMDSTAAFHDGLLLWIIGAIVAFVLALLLWVMLRYNHRANPTPATFTHNTLVEVLWTIVPIATLILIAIPSFGVLADQETLPDGERTYLGASLWDRGGGTVVPAPGLVVKATGNQWYWTYDYVDSDVGYLSFIDYEAEPRLLAVDNELVVPVNTTVQVQVTSDPTGVIHAFAVPAFGIKVDAVPGRLTQTWFYATKTGMYYGQCSELCGKDHAFMPIAVRVVEQDEFETWLETLVAEGNPEAANLTLASAN